MADVETELRTALRRQAALVPTDAGADQWSRLQASGRRSPRARWRVVAVAAAVAAIVAASFAVPALVGSPPPHDLRPGSTAVTVDGVAGRSLDGRRIDAADYRGAPLLVVAWGSWCTPCREQLAATQRVKRATGVRVLGIAARDRRATAIALEDELGLSFHSILDPRGEVAARLLGAPAGYPITWLVDADGRVVRTWRGVVDDWRPVLTSLASLATFTVDPASMRPGDLVRLVHHPQASHPLEYRLVPPPSAAGPATGWYEVRAGADDGRARWVGRRVMPRGSFSPIVTATGAVSFRLPPDARPGLWWLCAVGRPGDCQTLTVVPS